MQPPGFVPYRLARVPAAEMEARAARFLAELDARRSCRSFAADPVPRSLIEKAIRTASTAPSGAHRQPWRFVAVSDPLRKQQIRRAAEEEERASYESRMPDEWREALRPLGTDWRKPYLEIAPWLIVVFEEKHGVNQDGSVRKNYYTKESVGIACGMLLAALHHMGLATLTHTPSPMGFLARLLERPLHERPFLLIPVGYPAADCVVPDLVRKPLAEVAVFFDDRSAAG